MTIELHAQILGAEAVTARFQFAGPRVKDATRDAVRSLARDLMTKVKSEKLTGQVLKVRTGRLRRSINEKFVEDEGHMESRVGTNVVYGRFWELGFHGTQQVKEFTRTIRMAFGRPISPVQAVVHAHSRNVNQAPRPFLVPSLEEMRGEIRARLMRAMKVV
jgi:phage gpG-like protein